ncbi:zinc finger, CCHC-type containing protein [Tanacetum coccineum]
MVNSILSYSRLSQGLWGEAMLIACYLLNRVLNKRNRITPYELWTKRKLTELPQGFRFFVIEPNDSVVINLIIESRDAIFDENIFSSVPRPSLRIPNETEDIGGSVVPEDVTKKVVQQPEPELRKSKRNRNPKNFEPEFQLYLIEGTRDEVSDQHSYCFNVEDDPKTFDEAMKSQDGFKQKSGIDYFDTYAPVARISTIRLLIAMASIYNLIIHQMDVKTAFLNGDLDEEVYMNQPQGFIMPGNKNKVCKLIKTLYRLKQAPKKWHQKFDEVVLSNGYLLNQADKCVYSKFNESGKGVIIYVYVDDMLIFGTDQVQVDLTKEFLSSKFSMKDMGEADVILGIRIKHGSNGIAISHSHYIEKAVSQLEYSRVIGCLMYAMTCTRPDIAFVVGNMRRYTSNPGTQHWQAIQRVLKYLKKTVNYRLTYTGYPSVLEGYTDASWISNTKDNSSTSGWVFLLGGGAITWASKKQNCITGSTIEYEFVALAAAGEEVEWLKNLLLKIPLWSKPIAPISIRWDSAATLAKAYSQMYNGKSRHLGVRHSMICELITNEVISIEFVRSQQNLVDHLTKGLARDLVIKSAEEMGLKRRLKHMYLHIIPRMCLEPAEKEDEVFTSQWLISLKKCLAGAYIRGTTYVNVEIALVKEFTTTNIGTFPSSAEIVPEPLGVVLIISAWNYPLLLSVDPVIGAIAAGNAAKASDNLLIFELGGTVQSMVDSDIDLAFFGEDPIHSPDISRIVSSNHFTRLTNLLDDDKVSAKIIHGGQTDKNSLKIAPTIVLDAPEDSLIMKEEIFGPILPVVTLMVDTLPFGGIGESGTGAYHGKFSFDAFSHKKAVLYRSFIGDAPARYPPYTPGKLRLLKALLDGSVLGIIRALFGFS